MQTEHDLRGLRGLGYTLLGTAACAYAVAHYACWTLPRLAWLRWTGQLPPPNDPSAFTETDLGREGKG